MIGVRPAEGRMGTIAGTRWPAPGEAGAVLIGGYSRSAITGRRQPLNVPVVPTDPGNAVSRASVRRR
jgi:hypothetical protein